MEGHYQGKLSNLDNQESVLSCSRHLQFASAMLSYGRTILLFLFLVHCIPNITPTSRRVTHLPAPSTQFQCKTIWHLNYQKFVISMVKDNNVSLLFQKTRRQNKRAVMALDRPSNVRIQIKFDDNGVKNVNSCVLTRFFSIFRQCDLAFDPR